MYPRIYVECKYVGMYSRVSNNRGGLQWLGERWKIFGKLIKEKGRLELMGVRKMDGVENRKHILLK